MKELETLSRKHLIALAVQRTNLAYHNILAMDDHQLIEKLSKVENVLIPVQA